MTEANFKRRKNEYELAVKNIAPFGDTEIFPYPDPVENALFYDRQVISLIYAISL